MSGTKNSYRTFKRRASKHIKLALEQEELNCLVSEAQNLEFSKNNSIEKFCLSRSLNDISSLESDDECSMNVSNSPYGLNEETDVISNASNSPYILDEELSVSNNFSFESGSDEMNLTSTSNLDCSLSSVKCPPQEDSLFHKLRIWASNHKVTLISLNNLLSVLHGYHPELPLDGRTLLKTSRKAEIVKFNSGEFCYYGIAKYLQNLDLNGICPDHEIKLRINIDGLPLYKSSGTQFWPILGLIISKFKLSPFVIACYCGKTKPDSLEKFLRDFILEAKNLSASGFMQNNTLFKFTLHQFTCDAPARAYIKNIKNHNSYYGCEKCCIKGTTVDGHVRFLDMKSSKRSDENFASFMQEEHHNGISPLAELEIGLVTKFPLDPMHLLHLGVTRKLIMYWIRNGDRKKVHSVRITQKQSAAISERLLTLSESMPSEFDRKPRSLKDIDRWKAKEFRQFLLYLGPIVLKDILPEFLYIHFLSLHIASSVLSNSELSNQEVFIDFAEKMLFSFVEDMADYYGKKSIVYNVHNLLHIAEDVRLHGSLNNFSCYEFENYLGQIKRMLRTQVKPLSQISRRFSEQITISQTNKSSKMYFLHFLGKRAVRFGEGEEYKEVINNNVRFSSSNGKDQCIQIKNNRFMQIKHIIKVDSNDCIFLCNEIKTDGYFYKNPYKSDLTSIYNAVCVKNDIIKIQPFDIRSKCILNWKYKVLLVLVHKIGQDM